MKNSRILKRFGIITAILIAPFLAYLAALVFPQPFFPYQATYKNITLYSRNELPKNTDTILQKVDSLLSRSELYNPQAKFRIFVCDNYNLFWFYTVGLRHVFAATFPSTTRHIYVPKADYRRDLVLFEPFGPNDKRQRHLTNTLAHEITHLYIEDYLGRKAEFILPGWVKEGYCEYIGQADAVSADEGIRRLLSSQGDIPGLYYFRSRRMMQLLLDNKKMSIKQILSHPPDEAEIFGELMMTLKAKS